MLADVINASKLPAAQKKALAQRLAETLCSHQAENISKHIVSLDYMMLIAPDVEVSEDSTEWLFLNSLLWSTAEYAFNEKDTITVSDTILQWQLSLPEQHSQVYIPKIIIAHFENAEIIHRETKNPPKKVYSFYFS